MLSKRAFVLGTGSMLASGSTRHANAQSWPSRSIRVLIPVAPGGSADVAGRLIGAQLAKQMGQNVVVENMPTGSGIVAHQTVSRAEADGYTLMITHAGFPPQAAVMKSLPYDPIKGFTFISLLCSFPMAFGVVLNSPIKNFPDMIARAKTNPGKLSYAITTFGATHHLLGKWIDMQAGTDMVPVPYRGAEPGFVDVLGGRVDVMLEPLTTASPRVRNKLMRLIALSSPNRYPLMPDIPTVAETIPGVAAMSWLALIGPPNLPRPITDRLNNEVRTALTTQTIVDRFAQDATLTTPSTSEELTRRIEHEIGVWRRIVVANKIVIQ